MMVAELGELKVKDVKAITASLPEPVAEVLSENPGDVVLAGGFVRDIIAGVEPSDVDMFASRKVSASRFLTLARTYKITKSTTSIAEFAGPLPIQVIWPKAEPLEHVATRFDFACCLGLVAYGDDGWYGKCHPTFYKDVKDRRLTLLGADKVRSRSLQRVLKLVAKGCSIEPEDLATIVAGVVAMTPQASEMLLEEELLRQQLTAAWVTKKKGLVAKVKEVANAVVDTLTNALDEIDDAGYLEGRRARRGEPAINVIFGQAPRAPEPARPEAPRLTFRLPRAMPQFRVTTGHLAAAQAGLQGQTPVPRGITEILQEQQAMLAQMQNAPIQARNQYQYYAAPTPFAWNFAEAQPNGATIVNGVVTNVPRAAEEGGERR